MRTYGPLIGLLALLILGDSGPASAVSAPCDPSAPLPGEAYAQYAHRARRTLCRKPWTVLVYMAADNNLAPYALWDLREMEGGYKSGRVAAGSTARADLVVQVAYPGQAQSRRLHVFQSAEIYDSQKLTIRDFTQHRRGLGDVRSPVAGLVARSKGGAPVPPAEDFERFIEWGMREYPSEHYLVVAWGHGEGWAAEQPSAKKRQFGGMGHSDSNPGFLDVPGIRRALRSAESKVLDGRRVDVYVSDACLMQMVEVAAELSDSARYIVGSSQVENYLGLPYRRMMFEINTGRLASQRASQALGKADEPYLVARMLPILFRSSLQPGGLHGRELPEALETATFSAISSDELRNQLMPALERVAHALNDYLAEDPFRAISITQGLIDAPRFMGGSQELGAFLRMLQLRLLLDDAQLQSSATALELLASAGDAIQALDRSVLSYALGHRYSGAESDLYLLGFRALAVWLPLSPHELYARIRDFSQSSFYRDLGGAWEKWLNRLYGDPEASLLTSASSGNSRLNRSSTSRARSAWPSLR